MREVVIASFRLAKDNGRAMSETYDLGGESTPPTAQPIYSDIGDPTPVFAPPPPPAELVQKRRARRFLLQATGALVALLALAGGVALRAAIWDYASKPDVGLHHGDAAVAFDIGNRVLRGNVPDAAPLTAWGPFLRNYLAFYRTVAQAHPDGDYQLDNPPLRLLTVALWARHQELVQHDVRSWDSSLKFNAPILGFTAACECVAAIALFLLVRIWKRRWMTVRVGVDPIMAAESERPWVLGLTAGILLWINAATLLDGYVWGQSDAWLLPFFLIAACFASTERWFWAGIACCIGCFFKAQLLLVAPLFFLWPLFGGKPLAALRALFGFAIAAALLLSPWLIHRDMSWYRIAVVYGMHRFPQMTLDASNLPAIMGNATYKWSLDDTVWNIRLSHPRFAYDLTVRGMLISIYALSLLMCSVGAAMHARRKSVGALAAMVAPWVLLFAIVPEMQPRYLMWAAALSAAMAGVSLGMTLMHLIVTALAVVMMLRRLLPLNPDFAPHLQRALYGLHPHIAWAVLLCAAIFLYEALALPRKRLLHVGEPNQ